MPAIVESSDFRWMRLLSLCFRHHQNGLFRWKQQNKANLSFIYSHPFLRSFRSKKANFGEQSGVWNHNNGRWLLQGCPILAQHGCQAIVTNPNIQWWTTMKWIHVNGLIIATLFFQRRNAKINLHQPWSNLSVHTWQTTSQCHTVQMLKAQWMPWHFNHVFMKKACSPCPCSQND